MSDPGLRTTDELHADLARAAWQAGEAASTPAEARRWLERAQRIMPRDDVIGLSLALACLRMGDLAAAHRLFAGIAGRHDLAEAWLGLAAAAQRGGDLQTAETALTALLSRHAVDDAARLLAAAVATAAGRTGWCGIDPAGRLHADAPAQLRLDGRPVAARWVGGSCRLPPGAVLDAHRAGAPLLGSPIDLRAIGAVEGFVEASGGGLAGWAWRPRNPARAPALLLTFADGASRRIVARDLDDALDVGRPMARPRRFRIAAGSLPPGAVAIVAEDGHALLGSPVNPGLALRPVPAGMIGPASTAASIASPPRPQVDVVVPVHGGMRATLACLASVLASLPPGARLHVVDDAGTDAALAEALDALAQSGQVVLHRLARNLGFPGAANVGLRAAAGRDVALLNSDTLVPPGWLQALADAAHGAPDIGSACPLSNDATILSYPNRDGGNPLPDPAAMHALARRANGGATVDVPVAVGFCMFVRRDCLDAVGLLREDVWAQGYGEENDWCLRANRLGWRHVAAVGCFVAHVGGGTFGPARRHLLARNGALLERLHPGYDALVAAWLSRDPLGPARRRMDALRWRTGRLASAVALVTHASGGGVERVVRQRAAALQQAGVRPVVLRPDGDCVVVGDGDTPNLRYRLPADWDALLRLLRGDRVSLVEQHHTLGHAAVVAELAARLQAPLDVFVHDYASFCARIALVPAHRYCGEPAIAGCEACVAEHGSLLDEPIGPAALVARSAALLAGARRVVTPAADVAVRMRRHFAALQPVVSAWEDDRDITPPPPTRGPIRHVCVVGGIGVVKGYEVLLGCVQDAARRRLPLRFTVVGHTEDDERMLAAGPVFVTGRYQEAEVEALIRAQCADLALTPSVWPETWCFTLGQAWRAGLRAVVFDLGAPAERVRRTGWGHVLPLGLPPAALNDWLLRGGATTQRDGRDGPGMAQPPSPFSNTSVISR